MLLVFVRHGETAWNREGRYQGRSDQPLTADARSAGAILSSRMETLSLEAVVSSPLVRALDTARILSAGRIPVEEEPLLAEVAYGSWEGLTAGEIEERFPAAWAAYRRDRISTSPPGGESFLQVMERTAPLLPAWRQRYGKTARLLVVSHAGTLRAMLLHALAMPPLPSTRFSLSNLGVSVVEWWGEGKPSRLHGLNWTCIGPCVWPVLPGRS